MEFTKKIQMYHLKKQPIDCDYCNNQGEVDITEDVIKDLDDAGQLQ